MKVPDSLTLYQIERIIEHAPAETQYPREYLGLSQIGAKCSRYLWYTLIWAYKNSTDARVRRIFERGNIEEDRVIRDLVLAGCTVSRMQEEIIISPYVKGHIDGVVQDLPDSSKPHLLEIKTMNDDHFKNLLKVGLEKENFTYWAQAHLYMRCLGLERALFIATNKNTEQRFYLRIHLDKGLADVLLDRAEDITRRVIPPLKINTSPSWFECKYCPANEVCHYGATPERNCRTCEHSARTEEGWFCLKHDRSNPSERHAEGCDYYTKAEALSD